MHKPEVKPLNFDHYNSCCDLLQSRGYEPTDENRVRWQHKERPGHMIHALYDQWYHQLDDKIIAKGADALATRL